MHVGGSLYRVGLVHALWAKLRVRLNLTLLLFPTLRGKWEKGLFGLPFVGVPNPKAFRADLS